MCMVTMVHLIHFHLQCGENTNFLLTVQFTQNLPFMQICFLQPLRVSFQGMKLLQNFMHGSFTSENCLQMNSKSHGICLFFMGWHSGLYHLTSGFKWKVGSVFAISDRHTSSFAHLNRDILYWCRSCLVPYWKISVWWQGDTYFFFLYTDQFSEKLMI